MNHKIMQNYKTGIHDELMTMHNMVENAKDCISLLQNAFIYNNSLFLDECKVKVRAIKTELTHVTEKIQAAADNNPDAAAFLSVPDLLLNIVQSIETLSDTMEKKISDYVLFSDKAVKETTYLLQRLIEILEPTAEILLARNTFLSMYVEESQTDLGNTALEYSTLHEERLIEGVCMPAASAIYITILGLIKNIAWQSKEIAVKLAGP